MALRGDLPRADGPDPRRQHARRRPAGRRGADHPADRRQQQPRHRGPVYLRHPLIHRRRTRPLRRRRARGVQEMSEYVRCKLLSTIMHYSIRFAVDHYPIL